MTSTTQIDDLKQDLRELRILITVEPEGFRKKLFERLYGVCEKELADMVREASGGPPKPGYEKRRFVVFHDGNTCEAVALYAGGEDDPDVEITVDEARSWARDQFGGFGWGRDVATVIEAYVRAPDDSQVAFAFGEEVTE